MNKIHLISFYLISYLSIYLSIYWSIISVQTNILYVYCLQEKRESVEVALTLDILKHGKRFHATVRLAPFFYFLFLRRFLVLEIVLGDIFYILHLLRSVYSSLAILVRFADTVFHSYHNCFVRQHGRPCLTLKVIYPHPVLPKSFFL